MCSTAPSRPDGGAGEQPGEPRVSRVMNRRRADADVDPLSRPRSGGISLGLHYDPEAFGRFSEAIARTLGTARFLVIQTVVVISWIIFNIAAATLRYDPYPFILLNLAF